MTMIDIIERKKLNLPLSKDMIEYAVFGYTEGKIPDYQMSALLMAIYFNGMNDQEATHLAMAMKDSGDVIDLSMIDGIKVDKHSTGGVGDKVSLILAPLVAYFGLKLAKMSGRGLGHTGGTIDKLESIPGFEVERSKEDFIHQVNHDHIAIIGQSGNIAPADKKLYALRDVTATVNSIPLIASSIMSKKLASGADIIVLDVKVGDGAFMKSEEDAVTLAQLMVKIGHLSNKKVTAILTDMSQPLGYYIGNIHEVYEAVETLKGRGPEDLVHIVSTLMGHLLVMSQKDSQFDHAYTRVKEVLKSGDSYPYFESFIQNQHGKIEYLNDLTQYFAPNQVLVLSKKEGYIQEVEASAIGKAAMKLGAGREVKEDTIDHSVGIQLVKKVGDYVREGDILAHVYYQHKGIEECMSLIIQSYIIGNEKKTSIDIYQTIQ
jgi:pyrimidine-nucleoside phosphorylase